MDLDTTRTKGGYESILDSFATGETDILVGTQMVTKGLDFDRVSLVGVFDADRMMHFPDFRSHERAFQLITQVSGRSGRRETRGSVIIQTSQPDHPLFSFVLNHDVRGFIEFEMMDRQRYFYPPFSRLIEITVRHADRAVCHELAGTISDRIRASINGIRLMGPSEPVIAKIRNEFLMTSLLKIPRDRGHLADIKKSLVDLANDLTQLKAYRSARIIFDVDPV